MPDAAWAVSVHPPSLSREKGQPPVLTSSNPLSTLHRRFAYARLSQSCLPESRSGFPQRSPPWLLTTAACGGLRPAPDCRPRRAHLHLSYSCTCRLDRHARDTRPFSEVGLSNLLCCTTPLIPRVCLVPPGPTMTCSNFGRAENVRLSTRKPAHGFNEANDRWDAVAPTKIGHDERPFAAHSLCVLFHFRQ